MTDFAYVARGRLFVSVGGEPPREIESPFASNYVARSASLARKNAWKTQGRGARFMSGLGAAPEDVLDAARGVVPPRFTGVARGRTPAEVVYTLSTGPVAGLFSFSGGEEQRLYHGGDVPIAEPACHRDGETIVCSVGAKGGLSHIGLLRDDGNGVRVLTEGDTIDASPSWAENGKRVVYMSSGVGRDAAGNVAGVSAATIQELDVESGSLRCVAEKPDYDHAYPRLAADGTLYFVRRPHVGRAAFSIGRALLDAVLFPFRLAWAVFQFFNFFSVRYTGKPLINAGGARQKQNDLRQMLVQGNIMSAAYDATAASTEDELPTSWELVRKRGAEERVVARRVAAFDLADDGSLLYSTGRQIRRVDASGTEQTLVSDDGIALLASLPPALED